MRSIEVHLIQTASDIDTAIRTGLLEPAQVNGLRCAACGEEVGHVSGPLADYASFEEFALLLDDRDIAWFVCYGCAEDVLDPVEAVADKRYSTLFDEDEEFDRFDLLDE